MDDKITGGKNRRTQLRAAPDRGWTKARRTDFLDMLAATCNVTRAAAHIGVPKARAYALRRRDPQFAELWRQAILMGYDRLEEQLLDHAGGAAPINDITPDPDAVPPQPFDPKLAMDLLRLHRATVEGRAKPTQGAVVRASREEAEAALLKKLDALERRLTRERGAP